ncbi:MAG: hypothetical protein U9M90_03485 [Patescibacteria group bacterium]|nr:hypothetical protein [Patescibacteria group bacterium]
MNETLNKFPSPDQQREKIDGDKDKENNTGQIPEKVEQKTEQQQDLDESPEEPTIDHEEVREKDDLAIESAQRDLEDTLGNDPEQQIETDEETGEDNSDKDLESFGGNIETMDPEAQEYLEDLKRQQEAEFKGLNAEEIMSGELGPEKPKRTRLKKAMLAITAGAMLWMSSGALPEVAEAKSPTYGTERVIKKEVNRLQNLPAKEIKHFKKSLKKQTNRIFKTFLDSLF